MVEWLGGGGKARRIKQCGRMGVCLCVSVCGGVFAFFLRGLFNHYQGHPDGSAHILGLVHHTWLKAHLTCGLLFIVEMLRNNQRDN